MAKASPVAGSCACPQGGLASTGRMSDTTLNAFAGSGPIRLRFDTEQMKIRDPWRSARRRFDRFPVIAPSSILRQSDDLAPPCLPSDYPLMILASDLPTLDSVALLGHSCTTGDK
ncbi:hypothetical protein ColLi_04368 [Colletotrichum liriopes]|uniref:Uncharacterized protein n=1 Tax=Colletotrichum liriopes TaxID=708192 RepID=A0AA37GIG6_9PEZI|nr:hypothetical protein ColLi_04368 [Colletotrichum liriopes]